MELELVAHPASIRDGRHWAVERARDAGADGDTTRVVELLTSELVTNAVKYGPAGGRIVVRTVCRDDLFDVAVSDDSHVAPVTRDPRPSEPGGRGLRLVAQLSCDWGVRLHRGNGKSVWFRLRLPRRGAPHPSG